MGKNVFGKIKYLNKKVRNLYSNPFKNVILVINSDFFVDIVLKPTLKSAGKITIKK